MHKLLDQLTLLNSCLSKKAMKNNFTTFFVLIFIFICVNSQSSDNENNELTSADDYVKLGLQSNLSLKQNQLNYRQSIVALKLARSKFFPVVEIKSRHTHADGVRTFEVPTGDLLNPIHKTLNGLLNAQQFKTDVQNDIFDTIRKEEHESKLVISFPIYQPAIIDDYQSNKNLKSAQFYNLQTFKRRLTKDIKIACYEYLKSQKLLELFNETLNVVGENLKLNEDLYDNGRITEDILFSAKADFTQVLQFIFEVDLMLPSVHFDARQVMLGRFHLWHTISKIHRALF